MRRSDITYVTENEVIVEYRRALNAALCLEDMQDVGREWGKVFPDIVDVINKMSKADFTKWRKGLEKERRQEFAGGKFMERYGTILMPGLAIRASVMSEQYHIPWGCAYLRLSEEP